MAITFEIPAETRSDSGKGASRRLRRLDNKVPAVVYGAGQPALALSIDHFFLLRALEHEAFYTHILTLNVGGKKEKVVLKDLQRHSYKPRIIHVDLLRVDAKSPINMRVPLHFLGADVAPGVKDEGGVVSHLMNDVEVRCLPADLPEYIEVDLSAMKLNDMLHLSNIKLPKGVESIALSHGDDAGVASIHMPRVAEEEVTVVEEVAEEAPAAEEAAPAASEAKPEA